MNIFVLDLLVSLCYGNAHCELNLLEYFNKEDSVT
jgi:hypothetical protein